VEKIKWWKKTVRSGRGKKGGKEWHKTGDFKSFDGQQLLSEDV
jgi:hypothetical protein